MNAVLLSLGDVTEMSPFPLVRAGRPLPFTGFHPEMKKSTSRRSCVA